MPFSGSERDKTFREIALRKGEVCVIDAGDHAALSRYSWKLDNRGYVTRRVTRSKTKKSDLLMHRVITGAPVGMHVHHRNGDKLDNRRCNLTVLTQAEHAAEHKRMRQAGFTLADALVWTLLTLATALFLLGACLALWIVA